MNVKKQVFVLIKSMQIDGKSILKLRLFQILKIQTILIKTLFLRGLNWGN